MCGISAILRPVGSPDAIDRMVARLAHRGPDDRGTYRAAGDGIALGHDRLSVIDLSEDGRQPMASPDGRYWIAFNGEIYNHVELRAELADHPFQTRTDTEVLLAAWAAWGPDALERLLGMFAFVVWDARDRVLTAARDRFGVKPLYVHHAADGSLYLASEIKALHAAGVPAEVDPHTWADFLAHGVYERADASTFWQGVEALPAGTLLRHDASCTTVTRWYDLAARTGEEDDPRDAAGVAEEYLALLDESVALRFRADVPIGINISGGVDSSLLLALVRRTQGDAHADVRAFTFETGDTRYDETPWVRPMLERTGHPASVVRLSAAEVPDAARAVAEAQDEPYGGIPTLAYAKLFEEARRLGIIVLLDGQGMDEQWAGYDYYRRADDQALVQGGTSSHLQPQALCPEFAAMAQPPSFPRPFRDPLKNLQYRDLLHTKLPRALRFNDRVSMRVGCELREPFLDHRLVELALRQPRSRKIGDAGGKQMLRDIAGALVPERTRLAPKRPLQTPQREWLRGPLASWARDRIEHALEAFGGAWLDPVATRREWEAFCSGALDTSFFVWQWISISLAAEMASARSDGATG